MNSRRTWRWQSTALLDLRDRTTSPQENFLFRHIDLKEYSEVDLTGTLESLTAVEFDPSSAPVRLLDSVDEARFQIRTLVPLLSRRLKPLMAKGWRVIATCRTAETVQGLMSSSSRSKKGPSMCCSRCGNQMLLRLPKDTD